jgi:hypothetical protein
MWSCSTILTLTLYLLPFAQAQLVASLPKCIQECIDQSGDENCSITNIKCLCRASAGNFLPDLITCMHGNCDSKLDNNLLLTPLQFACQIAGVPIPNSAIQNAEDVESGLATQVTKTVTMSDDPDTGAATGTRKVGIPSMTTITVTTSKDGSLFTSAYSITEWHTTTISGAGSTVTPVSTKTRESTFTETTSLSASPSSESTDSTAAATSLEVAQSSSAETSSSSKTKSAPSEDETNSSPFKNTNSAVRGEIKNCFRLMTLMAIGMMLA